MRPSTKGQAGVSRRTVLKGAAAAIAGFPAIVSAQPVTLRYLGTAVNQSKEIAQKVKADLGLVIEYIQLRKLIPSGNLLGMDARRIKYADKITPVFTKGQVAGKTIGDQGTAPKKVFYLEGPTSWITLIPTVYNADTLGIRPDLIKRPIGSWAELLNSEFKGKASILNIP